MHLQRQENPREAASESFWDGGVKGAEEVDGWKTHCESICFPFTDKLIKPFWFHRDKRLGSGDSESSSSCSWPQKPRSFHGVREVGFQPGMKSEFPHWLQSPKAVDASPPPPLLQGLVLRHRAAFCEGVHVEAPPCTLNAGTRHIPPAAMVCTDSKVPVNSL